MFIPRFPRLHRSSLVIAAVVLVCGFVANLGGDFHPDEQLGIGRISFGFPWAYGDWEIREKKGFARNSAAFCARSRINVWYPFSFVGNIFAWLTIAGIIAGGWEWRRRKVKYLWQFTLIDGLLGSLLVASFYGVERWLCRDMFAERELRLTLVDPYRQEWGGPLLGTAEPLFSGKQDVPADWFWELLSVPESHRPYRRLDLVLNPTLPGKDPLSLRQSQLVGKLRDLKRFRCHIEVDDAGLEELIRSPTLKHFEVSSSKISDRGIRILMDRTQLELLRINDLEGRITDASLDLFAERKHLVTLELKGSSRSISLAAVQRLNAVIPNALIHRRR